MAACRRPVGVQPGQAAHAPLAQKGQSLVFCSALTVFVTFCELGPLAFILHWGPQVTRSSCVWEPLFGALELVEGPPPRAAG